MSACQDLFADMDPPWQPVWMKPQEDEHGALFVHRDPYEDDLPLVRYGCPRCDAQAMVEVTDEMLFGNPKPPLPSVTCHACTDAEASRRRRRNAAR
jgi:hypothetical protein